MRYPFSLFVDSAKHLATHRLLGHRKFPLVLSLDPLGSCSCKCPKKSCSPNGDLATEPQILTLGQCLAAVDECKAPIVLIRGGEPLAYPHIPELTQEILKRRKHLFLCTDGTLIRRRLHMIPPESNFFWNVRLDGTDSVHDSRAARPGLFAEALDGIRAAKNAGFFVVVTTTIYPDTDVRDVAVLYNDLHALHVDGYVFSPGYPRKSLCRDSSAVFRREMQQRFRELSGSLSCFNLLISPVYFEYLRGERELDCSAWANPVFGPQGWLAPCSQINKGHEKSYEALAENTLWENYGRGMNPSCEPCMCHAGYEMAALLGANRNFADLWKILSWQFHGNLGQRRERAPAK